ncbi:MAG: nucleoside phosphorylase [Dehalococcoidia bacterium]
MTSDAGPSRFFERGTPRLRPQAALDALARRHALPVDTITLPPVAIASFFSTVTDQLVTATGAQETVFARRRASAGRVYATEAIAVGTMGMGAPAAVMHLEEWAAAGVRTLLVIGAAGTLQPAAPIGAVVLAERAIRKEGTSYHYLAADRPARATPGLVDAWQRALAAAGAMAHRGEHWTTDAPYREHVEKIRRYRAHGVLSVDMEVSALYAAAEALGLRCAAGLAISDVLFDDDGWVGGFDGDAYAGALRALSESALAVARSLDRE